MSTKTHFDVYPGDAIIKSGMGEFVTTAGQSITAAVEKVDSDTIETREFIFHLVERPEAPPVVPAESTIVTGREDPEGEE